MDTSQLNLWLESWKAGNLQARDALIQAAYPGLQVLARKMLRGFANLRPLNDTPDVVQNAALRLMRSLRRVDPPPATTSEFFGLAAVEIRRELLDLARACATQKRTGGLQRVEEGLDKELPDELASVEELDRWTAFHEAVARLPAEERAVVGLRFYHGWTERQVAELLGVSERTVIRRWHRACLELRSLLGGELPGG